MHIFVSPHLDDAVLSCGGQIAQLVRAGQRVWIVTIFAGNVPLNVADSAFVQELHARWGLGPNPPAARRAEDQAALETLGLTTGIVHLPFPDCVYRVGRMGAPLYPSREAIFGRVAEVEAEMMIQQVERALRRLALARDAAVILPLTAGHHVDHQIARAAGERWAGTRRPVLYYEDYPYAEQPDQVAAALNGEALQAREVKLDQQAMAAKIAAIACYHSQLSSFFTGEADMAVRVRAYAQAIGAGWPAERLWHTSSKAASWP